MLDHLLYFSLGFVAATAVFSFTIFVWLRKRWQSMLLGMGAKLFTKGMNKVAEKRAKSAGHVRAETRPENFREVGRQ